MKTAIAIRHVAFEDLGSLEYVLGQRGYAIRYIEAGSANLGEIDPITPDLVVILGGPIGAYDEQDYPFLQDEFRLLEKRLTDDLPTLGICLGAQLIARVLGAKVYPGQGKEIGWSPLILTDAGQQSPMKYLAPELTPVLHWHGDTFDLPPDTMHLAASSQYQHQAFAYRQRGLALQFHPEVTPQGLERWFIGHSCEIGSTPNVQVSELRQATCRYGSQLQTQATLLWNEWLNTVEIH
ncbi:MAG: glutamine amidotransferase [Microcoleaceae cyanobacterium]